MLRMRNVSYSYDGRTKVVQDLNFHIRKGETIGLIGASGGGKSTICHMILGLLRPSSGEISLDGQSIRKWQAEKRLHTMVQLVMQNAETSFDPSKTIHYSLSEVSRFRAQTNLEERIREGLTMMELSEKMLDRRPEELSGGQLQRFAILRALLMNPKVLILDEVTSMLDPFVQAEIIRLLREMKTKFNLTYLVVSHDTDLLRYFSDRCLLLKNGFVSEWKETEAMV